MECSVTENYLAQKAKEDDKDSERSGIPSSEAQIRELSTE